MPVDENNTVHFTTTLFALIRESLKIKLLSMEDADESQMDQADEELRHIVMKLWPFMDIKDINLALPLRDGSILSLIYKRTTDNLNTII